MGTMLSEKGGSTTSGALSDEAVASHSMAVHSSPAIVMIARIQNAKPANTAALTVRFRKAGSTSTRRFREAADKARRVGIGG